MKFTLALSILFSLTSTVTCQWSGAGGEGVVVRSESETLSFFWWDPVNKEEMWKGPYTRDDGVKCYSGLGGWDGIKADAGKGCVRAYSYEECTGKFTKIDLGITETEGNKYNFANDDERLSVSFQFVSTACGEAYDAPIEDPVAYLDAA